MIKYFHELRKEEFAWLVAEKTTWKEVAKDFPQPPWCGYPEAIHALGCWSLIRFDENGCRVTGEEFCKDCDLYWKYETGKSFKT